MKMHGEDSASGKQERVGRFQAFPFRLPFDDRTVDDPEWILTPNGARSLKDPNFLEASDLEPFTVYERNGFKYFTGERLRDGTVPVVKATGEPSGAIPRNNRHERKVSERYDPGDHFGHLFMASEGGTSEQINAVPQSKGLNTGKEWRGLEEYRRARKELGGAVWVTYSIEWSDNGRPEKFTVEHIFQSERGIESRTDTFLNRDSDNHLGPPIPTRKLVNGRMYPAVPDELSKPQLTEIYRVRAATGRHSQNAEKALDADLTVRRERIHAQGPSSSVLRVVGAQPGRRTNDYDQWLTHAAEIDRLRTVWPEEPRAGSAARRQHDCELQRINAQRTIDRSRGYSW